MAVNVKMGVDLGNFTAGIRQGQTILKGLNAEMKATDAEFKATGNAEQYMANKTKTLNSQLNVQKGVVDQAKAALKAMDKEGIDPADKDYQKLYTTLMQAQAGMYETQAAMNSLGDSAQQAATGADQLTNSVNSIGKKISLDQVISGIDRITSGLENAAKKAFQLGTEIWNNIMDSARLSDDILTQAGALDMTPEQYQRYKGVFDTIGEITITEWFATKRKIQKAINDPSSDQLDVLSMLGVTTHEMHAGKYGEVEGLAKNWEDMFWEAAQALKEKVDSGLISQDLADTYGEALFGKKFSNLKNLIKLGREGFIEALDQQNIASEEALEKNAALNDAVIKLQNSYDALKQEVTSGLAPALTTATETLDKLLGKILEYLQTPEGQEMLKDLGDTISSLFEDLGEIDPESVVESFTKVFNGLVDGLKWIVKNKQLVIDALKGIVIGWGALKLTGGALQIFKLIDGLKGLGLGGGSGAGTGAGTGAGAGAGASAGGGWLTGVSNTLAGVMPGIASWISYNGGPVWDWFTHEGPFGTLISGLQTPQEWFAEKVGNVSKNAETFVSDWKALLRNLFGWIDPPADQEYLDFEEELRQRIDEDLNREPFDFVAEPQVDEQASSQVAEQIGTVHVPISFYIPGGLGGGKFGWSTGGSGTFYYEQGYANGLRDVPNDGLYRLHKGERVTPAREVDSRSFSSNLYVENMNMNGGLSADALASAIASRNRRIMSGYGS